MFAPNIDQYIIFFKTNSIHIISMHLLCYNKPITSQGERVSFVFQNDISLHNIIYSHYNIEIDMVNSKQVEDTSSSF